MSKFASAVITAALRTPIGKFNGALAAYSAVELVTRTRLLENLLARGGVAADAVDEVILGNVLGAGLGQNVARQVAIGSGLAVDVPAFTVNRVCASGLTAIALAAQSVLAGNAQVVVAGGTESMSNAPYVLQRRGGSKLGNLQLIDTMVHDGLWDAFYDYHMGMTAENIVAAWKLTRAAQDVYALTSHQRAVAAETNNAFAAERLPFAVTGKQQGTELKLAADEGPRATTSVERLAQLKPVFKQDGSVTAGNAASINDGAALVLVTSAHYAREHNLPVLATIRGEATVGVDPQTMGHAPYQALQKLALRTGVALADVELFELNEAFAAQCLSVTQALTLPAEQVNVHGGAIALGHPIGASGARIVVTLLHALQRYNKRLGAAALCVGGGQGVAMLFERPSK